MAIITGANRGIGHSIAQGIAHADFRTVLVCRRREDGERAREEIASRTGNHALEVMTADLSSLAEVRRLGDELVARHPVVHVLVNNAAVASRERRESVDGIEMTLAVNHLAPFELTRRLLPALQRGAPSRVVTLSSGAHQGQKLVFDDLENVRRRYRGVRAYGETKLMNVLFTRELARRTAGTGVVANCCHPGVIATRLVLDYLPALLRPLVGTLAGTPGKGADTAVWLASSSEVAGATGGYYIRRRLARTSPLADDAELAQRLWTESEQLIARAIS